MTRLSVCGVEFSYGARKALEQINFELDAGELAGLLGPNGSGKTTLLRTMARVLKPKVGAVYIDRRDLEEMTSREAAKLLAHVPQETTISFDFRALDVVLMGRYPHARPFSGESPEDLKKTRHAMELTGCWQFASRNVNELSSGEKQKVIIARALAQEPKVLLLDEPTSHLDLANQIEILDLMRRLCCEARLTVVSVFHDLNLAMTYCTTALMMNGGRIVAGGPVETVLAPHRIKEVYGVTVELVGARSKAPFIIPVGLASQAS